jgi:hypothetical protein
MSFHKKIEKGQETIKYRDVVSLYPYVCKYGKFPIGQTVIHAGNACQDIDAMLKKEGLIQCVISPKKLFDQVFYFLHLEV